MDWVRLPEGKDWLYRPVLARLIPYSALLDGSLDLEDVAELNDLLDARDENSRRQEAAERKS